jgi:2-polyprenyl-3-methyl-5-hydroxy-6-metoxy-1,4-benzoquinol methylase
MVNGLHPETAERRADIFSIMGTADAERRCRICGQLADATSTQLVSNGYELFSCHSCGTAMIEARPDSGDLNRAYNHLFEQGAYDAHRIEFEQLKRGKSPANFHRRRALKRLELICTGRNLIEIGGGVGAFGMLASSRGWTYCDYDVSEAAVRFARDLKLNAHVFSIDEGPPLVPTSADVVVMWEVIEHVWNLFDYLNSIHKALRPGGLFMFSTPNYQRQGYKDAIAQGKSLGSVPPIHINFFTVASAQATLKAAGFKLCHVTKRRLYRPTMSVGGVVRSAKLACGLEEPMTLVGLAKKTC